MVTAPRRALSDAFNMVDIIIYGYFCCTALTILKSDATKQNFILRLTTFSLLNLRLSLDCKFSIKNFKWVMTLN